ncbi:hypothetical protein [Aestuariivita boseongensis]|uniref:hypothetical protein n=1 Tax=Aestuariivita boseongensis TaxID=1470562 RepID=UPI0009E43399|nr:hypothetical protein [Aestuariivita boseongensis]
MRLHLGLLCLLLAACNTPGPGFRGVAAQRVTVDGSTFDVRVRGKLAEAIRINPQYAPRLGPIEGRAAKAMAQVSGCKVKKVSGDQAQLLGQLDCGGRTVIWYPGPPITLYCDAIGGVDHLAYLDLDCTVE